MTRADAILQEIEAQRAMLGTRAAMFAGDLADSKAVNATLSARVLELEAKIAALEAAAQSETEPEPHISDHP